MTTLWGIADGAVSGRSGDGDLVWAKSFAGEGWALGLRGILPAGTSVSRVFRSFGGCRDARQRDRAGTV